VNKVHIKNIFNLGPICGAKSKYTDMAFEMSGVPATCKTCINEMERRKNGHRTQDGQDG
jgi:hypothetical protein